MNTQFKMYKKSLIFITALVQIFVITSSKPSSYDQYSNAISPMDTYNRNQMNNYIYLTDSQIPMTDELTVEEVEENLDLKVNSNVTKWMRLNVGSELYLLGLGTTDGTLVTIYKTMGNMIQVHELPNLFSHKIDSAVMFQTKTDGIHTLVKAYVITSSSTPHTNYISWYLINQLSLKPIMKIEREYKIMDMIHFTIGGENRLLLLETRENNGTFVMMYGINFINSTPHTWFLESLPLDKPVQSWAINKLPDDSVQLYIISKGIRKMSVYGYDTSCSQDIYGKFQQKQFYEDVGEDLYVFSAYGESYVAILGSNSQIYRIGLKGKLIPAGDLQYVSEMLVIPVRTGRQDVIVLGKLRNGAVSMYLCNEQGVWVKKATPKCNKSGQDVPVSVDITDCFGGDRSWKGATYLDISDLPILLFANRRQIGEMYNVLVTLRPVPALAPQNVYYLDNIKDQLEFTWNELRSSMVEAKSSDVPNKLTSVCNVASKLSHMLRLISDTQLRLGNPECPNLSSIISKIERKDEVETSTMKSSEVYHTGEADNPIPSSMRETERYKVDSDDLYTSFTPEMMKYRKISDELTSIVESPYSLRTKGK